MVYGSYELLLEAHEQIYAFLRHLDGERWLVVLNFTADRPVFALPSVVAFADHDLIIGNYPTEPQADPRLFTLKPYEARVYRLRHAPRALKGRQGAGGEHE
jgi:oligo-1,6-glucosidase